MVKRVYIVIVLSWANDSELRGVYAHTEAYSTREAAEREAAGWVRDGVAVLIHEREVQE